MDMQLTHLRLLTQDYKASFSFYRDILQLPVKRGNEVSGYAEFGAGDVVLAIFCRKHMAGVVGTEELPVPDFSNDTSVVILRVPNVDDAVEVLEERGVSLTSLPVDRPGWKIRTAHLRDPDGHLIELNQTLV